MNKQLFPLILLSMTCVEQRVVCQKPSEKQPLSPLEKALLPLIRVGISPKTHAAAGAVTAALPAGAVAASATYAGIPSIDAFLRKKFPEKYGKLRDRIWQKIADKLPKKHRAKLIRAARLAASAGVGTVAGVAAGAAGAFAGDTAAKIAFELSPELGGRFFLRQELVAAEKTIRTNLEGLENLYKKHKLNPAAIWSGDVLNNVKGVNGLGSIQLHAIVDTISRVHKVFECRRDKKRTDELKRKFDGKVKKLFEDKAVIREYVSHATSGIATETLYNCNTEYYKRVAQNILTLLPLMPDDVKSKINASNDLEEKLNKCLEQDETTADRFPESLFYEELGNSDF